MPQQVSIDDTNTTLIQYSGTWEPIVGSTRQWEGTTHTSLDPGASATFSFRGYQVWVWGTIPAGTGSNLFDVAIDGGSPIVASRVSNGEAVYADVHFESPTLRDTFHTIVLRNLGSRENGQTELQFDRFMFETNDEFPKFTPPGGGIITTGGVIASSTPSSSLPSASSDPQPSSTGSSSSSSSNVGAIAGGVIGGLVVIIIILAFFLWKRRKASRGRELGNNSDARPSSLTAVPFPLSPGPTSLISGAQMSENGVYYPATGSSQNPPLSEKARYIRQSEPLDMQPNTSQADSSIRSPETPSSASRSLQHQPSLGMSDMSSMYVPNHAQGQAGFHHSVTDITNSSIPEVNEAPLPAHPPPAYNHGEVRGDLP